MQNQETSYEIITQTGKHALAGTDANVFIQIKGEQGSLDEVPLSSNGHNPFEKEQRDTFVLTGKDIGNITAITIRHDNSNKNAGWHLESVIVKNTTHPEREETFFRCNKWLTEKELSVTLTPSPKPDRITRYEIITQTGKHALAGTDANVFIQIKGERGSLDEMPLSSNGHNPFEKEQRDTFVLTGKDIGNITAITIRHDNSNQDAGWHLESVIVKNTAYPEQEGSFFRCNKWLTEKELSVALTPSPRPAHLK